MENALIQKLQNEVGLTSEQAKQAVDCMRSYIIEKQGGPDWDSFLKNKANQYAEQAVDAGQTFTEKLSDLKEKATEKMDDLSDKAQNAIRDLRSKAADFIAPD